MKEEGLVYFFVTEDTFGFSTFDFSERFFCEKYDSKIII